MDIESFTQYGVAVVTLGVLVYVIKLFMKMSDKFIGVIENHLTHSSESQNQLSQAINMMLKFLERNNK